MKIRIFIIVLLTLVILFIVGCRNAGSWLVKEDNPTSGDAIVVLMGSIADRVLHTADIYAQKKVGKVIVVEESMGAFSELEDRGADIISNSTQARNAMIKLEIPADSIVLLPGDATSTQMEAIVVRDYLRNHKDIDTLIIVSSSTHMRRASMIFKGAVKELEQPVAILTSPSTYTNFNKEKWWKDREGIQRVLMEYVKILNFVLFERGELRRG